MASRSLTHVVLFGSDPSLNLSLVRLSLDIRGQLRFNSSRSVGVGMSSSGIDMCSGSGSSSLLLLSLRATGILDWAGIVDNIVVVVC
jgi:hypothetical protein